MKKREIVVGGIYTNKKGAVRKFIGMGPEFKGTSESGNQIQNCTVTAFANWAKERTDNGQPA